MPLGLKLEGTLLQIMLQVFRNVPHLAFFPEGVCTKIVVTCRKGTDIESEV